ncbi:MATE family efflux transporter [Bacillaceae bacterium Marseille-Q3522]|nr:MATE family efflux transporter [Bacillaceae bacterium Marseille-Q3522]
MSTEKTAFQEQTLFQITWPMLIELTLHLGMGIFATFMLSQYSDDAASGVGVANQLLNIFILVFTVSSMGATVLISQSLGAQQIQKARQLARSVFSLNFWFGIIIVFSVLIFGKPMLQLFNIEGNVFEYGLTFLYICGASLFLESLSLALSAVLRSYGYMKESMVVTVLMDLICIAGSIIAITGFWFIPVTGVTGVALAMAIARVFAVIALIYYVYHRLALKLTFRDLFQAKKEDIRGLFSIGIPSAGENLSYQFSQLVITAIVASLGAASLASRIYLLNISMICYLFTMAIGQGTQLLVARYIGGKQFERAFKRGIKTLKIAMIASGAASLLLALAGAPVIGLFTKDPEIIAVSLPVLWAVAFTEPGRAMNIVLMNALKSTGDVRFPVIIGIISMWGIAVALSYALGIHFGLGLLGVWIAQGADEWFRGCFALKRWQKRPWESTVPKKIRWRWKAVKSSS